ncbi:WLM domain-containing protein [Amylostereum chailletii]|nr:WLM domain-containing protein [Amylostereum chailletii]
MSTDVWVLSFEHLRGRPREDEALVMLQKIASLVKPIMRKHGWRLPALAEFFPESPNLIVARLECVRCLVGDRSGSNLAIDINGGQKILLRLRPAWAPDTFYPQEDVIRTMLHELTHNVHGPHDQHFYKFLSGLEDEYEALQRSGYAGEGFFTKGHRLGAGASHNLPPHVARLRALQAAERRKQVGSVLGGGGRLGGGDLANLGLSPRELAVLAADMRAADEKACASGDLARQEAERAFKESIQSAGFDRSAQDDDDDDIIILDSPPPTAGSSRNGSTSRTERNRPPPIPSSTKPKPPPVDRSSRPAQWTCTTCTLINEPHAAACEACLALRAKTKPNPPPPPVPLPSGWDCAVCGEKGMEHQFWTCTFCGSVKASSALG